MYAPCTTFHWFVNPEARTSARWDNQGADFIGPYIWRKSPRHANGLSLLIHSISVLVSLFIGCIISAPLLFSCRARGVFGLCVVGLINEVSVVNFSTKTGLTEAEMFPPLPVQFTWIFSPSLYVSEAYSGLILKVCAPK